MRGAGLWCLKRRRHSGLHLLERLAFELAPFHEYIHRLQPYHPTTLMSPQHPNTRSKEYAHGNRATHVHALNHHISLTRDHLSPSHAGSLGPSTLLTVAQRKQRLNPDWPVYRSWLTHTRWMSLDGQSLRVGCKPRGGGVGSVSKLSQGTLRLWRRVCGLGYLLHLV
jgi:hypothetical protein